jgi:hypothetical protein
MAVRISDAGLLAIAPVLPIGGRDEDCQASQNNGARTDDTGAPAQPGAEHSPIGPTAPGPAQKATVAGSVPGARITLRQAAQALLDAWDGLPEPKVAEMLTGPIAALRAHLARAPARGNGGGPRRPREWTKQQQVLALLGRTEGASGPAIIEATGWAPHTVRGLPCRPEEEGQRNRSSGTGAAGWAE